MGSEFVREVSVSTIPPRGSLVAFATAVIEPGIRISGIGVHRTPSGYSFTWPGKNLRNGREIKFIQFHNKGLERMIVAKLEAEAERAVGDLWGAMADAVSDGESNGHKD